MSKSRSVTSGGKFPEQRGRQESIYMSPAALARVARDMEATIHRSSRCVFAARDEPTPPMGRRNPAGLPNVLLRTRTPGGKANVAMDCPALKRAPLSVSTHDGDWREFVLPQHAATEAQGAVRERGMSGVANGPRPSVDHTPYEVNPNVGIARLYVPLFTAEKLVVVSGNSYTQVVCLAYEHVLATNLAAVRTRLERLGEVVDNRAFPSAAAVSSLIAGAYHDHDVDVVAPVATSLVLEQRFVALQ